MPGFGPILGAQLLVAAGDLRATPAPATWPLQPAWCRSATPLADDPANLHKPRRYSRPLRHVFYLSAQISTSRSAWR